MEHSQRIVCRYYSTKGECFYGSECQYLHQSPQHRVSESPLAPESKLLSRWLPQDISNSSNGLDAKMAGKFAPPRSSSAAASYPPAAFTMNSVNTVPRFAGQATHLTQLPAAPVSHFASDDIREQLLQRHALTLALPVMDAGLPLRVGSYQDLCPLEEVSGHHSKSLSGVVTSVFKATDITSGEVVCLHRVHNFSHPTASVMKGLQQVYDVWKKVTCSNIVPLRNVFLTKDFGDTSLVFVYEYFPGAKTLTSQYFAASGNGSMNGGAAGFNQARPYSQQQTKVIPESLIWNYVIQLSSALRVIHTNGLACRSFDASKVLMTSGCLPDPQYITNQALMQQVKNQPRLRLSCSGIVDIVMFDAAGSHSQKAAVAAQQQEDLLSFGKLCLSLACNSPQVADPGKWQQSLDLVSRQYTPDLRSLICHLLTAKSGSGRVISINDIMPIIGARFYAQLDLSNQRFDFVERELSKELDNARLFRLLCKLGCINERPEHKLDPQWSETGDRYLVKLFRDYLMYQVSEDGRPLLDVSHIISSLNRLEQGSPEKVCLVSRDEQNVLIVSYAELKKCFDSSFDDLFPPEPQQR